MTDQTTTTEAGLQSALSADVSATGENPLGEARKADRIARIKALSDRFGEYAGELVRSAYRLGLELKALREQTEYGRWERLFDTELTFITKRRANSFIALGQTFKSEQELRGLTLTQALDRARCSRSNAPRARRAPGHAGTTYVRKLAAFHSYLDRTELDEIGDQLAASDRDEAIAHWTAIVQAANEAISRLKRPGQSTPAACETCLPSPPGSVTPDVAESSRQMAELLETVATLGAMQPVAAAKRQARTTALKPCHKNSKPHLCDHRQHLGPRKGARKRSPKKRSPERRDKGRDKGVRSHSGRRYKPP